MNPEVKLLKKVGIIVLSIIAIIAGVLFPVSTIQAGNSAITVNETPVVTVNETPVVTVNETPVVTVNETPVVTVNETPVVTVNETPVVTVNETPVVTVNETPVVTVNETPVVTVNETPVVTVNETPVVTVNETPNVTSTPIIYVPSSGGNSGGMDVSSSESFSNIVKFERQSKDLVVNKSIAYSFSSPEFSIYQVLVVSNTNDIDISMRVEHLKNLSANVDEISDGTVYAYENVIIASTRINYATIKFRVRNTWLADNEIGNDSITLLRYDNGWKRLQTNVTNSDDNYTYFESISPVLSSFAISGLAAENIVTQTVSNVSVSRVESGNLSPDTIEVAGKKSVSVWFEIVVAMIAVVLVASIIRAKK